MTREAGARETLPRDVLGAMLVDVAPAAPQPALARAVRERVAARLAGAPRPVLAETGWRPFLEGIDMKVLHDDGRTRSWLLRLAPGGALPYHVHDAGDEECVVLEGEVWVNDVRYGRGDYTVALRGTVHERVHSVTGAVIYLRSPSPRASAPAG